MENGGTMLAHADPERIENLTLEAEETMRSRTCTLSICALSILLLVPHVQAAPPGPGWNRSECDRIIEQARSFVATLMVVAAERGKVEDALTRAANQLGPNARVTVRRTRSGGHWDIIDDAGIRIAHKAGPGTAGERCLVVRDGQKLTTVRAYAPAYPATRVRISEVARAGQVISAWTSVNRAEWSPQTGLRGYTQANTFRYGSPKQPGYEVGHSQIRFDRHGRQVD